ncbi:MAG: DUF402 domain-containing protein [Candidatus Marinimicrobia bacterium]|jgi:hypothetical protein|nr:DUF402 domain-containing protein [Candidatus Neomarinimicrobiota bacterium]
MNKCLEIKHILAGEKRIFECELIYTDYKFGILKYVLEKSYTVSNLLLPKGTITYAFYWVDRPYTLYKWYDGRKNLANYFNIADRITLLVNKFEWRDLIVDILISPKGIVEVLDEDEIPEGIDLEIKKYIYQNKEYILREYPQIILETDQILIETL